jgi:hypothetical protein
MSMTKPTSEQVTFLASGSGAVQRTALDKFRETVSVKDFGAKGDGVTDDSVAIQTAINTGNIVWFPKGTYMCNVYMGNAILAGEGSVSTFIRPFNTAIAAVTVWTSTPYWSSHKEIRNIGFEGQGTRQGVGVAFGITDITAINFAGGFTSDSPGNAPGTYGRSFIQFAQSVKFYGCYFRNLHKGITWEAGNIGSEIIACSASNCDYGFYMLNNKGGGNPMQSGCKYFFGGEISGCSVGMYSHNQNTLNGQIALYGTVIENNQVGLYSFSSGGMFTPIALDSVWFEDNGSKKQAGGQPATISIDGYTGSATTLVKAPQSVPRVGIVLDGDDMDYVFRSSFIGDMAVLGTKIRVHVTNSRIETAVSCTGGDISVSNPDTSQVHIKDCKGGCAVNVSTPDGVTYENLDRVRTVAATPGTFWVWPVPHRSSLAPAGTSIRRAAAQTFAGGAVTATGTATLTGTVVSDGVIYAQCNEYTRNPMALGEYFTPANTSFTTTAGYYVCTVDVKVISGGVELFVWDANTAQWFGRARGVIGKWVTFGSIAYSPGSQTMRLDMGNFVGNCVWRMSAYQVVRFDTKWEAIDYLNSRAYCEP